jgi:hypothetical protein
MERIGSVRKEGKITGFQQSQKYFKLMNFILDFFLSTLCYFGKKMTFFMGISYQDPQNPMIGFHHSRWRGTFIQVNASKF